MNHVKELLPGEPFDILDVKTISIMRSLDFGLDDFLLHVGIASFRTRSEKPTETTMATIP